MIWLHGEEALREFLSYANTYHENIKFAWEWLENELPFLDVLVKRRDGKLTTDIYSKPTDTRQYVDHSSCHPNHVKKGIPSDQLIDNQNSKTLLIKSFFSI